ncbi:hypothetical protein BURMUCGD1_4421 [Burkholderia multivorans CGD1]|nr:hypothetical protein BURMUCGD1_4421 [Burkholderia multivorans CGD1]
MLHNGRFGLLRFLVFSKMRFTRPSQPGDKSATRPFIHRY